MHGQRARSTRIGNILEQKNEIRELKSPWVTGKARQWQTNDLTMLTEPVTHPRPRSSLPISALVAQSVFCSFIF